MTHECIPITVTARRFGYYTATCEYDGRKFKQTAKGYNRARSVLRSAVERHRALRAPAGSGARPGKTWADIIYFNGGTS